MAPFVGKGYDIVPYVELYDRAIFATTMYATTRHVVHATCGSVFERVTLYPFFLGRMRVRYAMDCRGNHDIYPHVGALLRRRFLRQHELYLQYCSSCGSVRWFSI